jgi:heme exporter protein D
VGIWVELGVFLLVFIFGVHQLVDLKREKQKREQRREEQQKAEQQKSEQPFASGTVNDTKRSE